MAAVTLVMSLIYYRLVKQERRQRRWTRFPSGCGSQIVRRSIITVKRASTNENNGKDEEDPTPASPTANNNNRETHNINGSSA
eukprot:CAMPEP_0172557258 /NCGR_PEP_ID=MMETSP1067-20121228/72302_1 /TAXON_ID=265564 ORGANISM="Thalassiosira punctigera, Strain Tpunct2005C2" /NCGR_SAMPLE_ID=MMETSP1067 /ASSEMBLY_ACC=CAM_ASM_000444 /LENGTH=82 /DNA_ID=CAMNT_0013346301 /DNA_START=105 /DNA_END=349 /DNA_ORIENTATION=-